MVPAYAHQDQGGDACGIDGCQVVQVDEDAVDGEVFEQDLHGG
ncbi:hypothetical protein [Catellatospora sichuanensis]|nr:hypothetical protein [Catellatospora sichuanensis]